MEGLRRHQSVSRVRLHVLTPDMTYVEQRMWQKAEILRVEGWLGGEWHLLEASASTQGQNKGRSKRLPQRERLRIQR